MNNVSFEIGKSGLETCVFYNDIDISRHIRRITIDCRGHELTTAKIELQPTHFEIQMDNGILIELLQRDKHVIKKIDGEDQ